MKPFFSIIIPFCDVEKYVEECLQTVLDQSFQDWECLIGIEESTDRTEEVIRKMTAGDPPFQYLHRTTNRVGFRIQKLCDRPGTGRIRHLHRR